MRLPCLKMGSGSRSSTNGACTYVANRSSSWIWTARCAQRRQIDGLISTAHSSSTSRIDARLLSTQMPMCTSSHHRLSGGQSRSLSRRRSTRSTKLLSSCRTDRSSSSNKRSRLSSSRTCSLVCSKLKASSRSMTTKQTLKTSFMLMAIGVLSTSTSSSTLKIRGRLAKNVTRALMKITRRMWCCKFPSLLYSLLLDATVSRPNETATTTRASLMRRLLCRMSLSRWHCNISSQMC